MFTERNYLSCQEKPGKVSVKMETKARSKKPIASFFKSVLFLSGRVGDDQKTNLVQVGSE